MSIMEMDIRKNDFDDLFGSRRKLTWVSREDRERICASDSRVDDVCPSIQKDSARLASCTGRNSDSPARGAGYIRTESPARKGESVRRIRTPTIDINMIEKASSNLFTNHGLRSILSQPPPGSKGDFEVVKSEHNLVKPGRIAHYHAITKDFDAERKGWSSAEDTVTPGGNSLDSSESFRMVVSYLAEETDRIIKARTSLNLRSNTINAADHLPTGTDNETSSDAVLRNGGQRQGPPSLLGSPLVTKQSTDTPSTGSARPISATMKAYLESRRTGTNMGSQILLANNNRPGAAPGTHSKEFHSNVSALANDSENPSSKIGIGRFDHFNPPRAALSPLNGNEDLITHSIPPSTQGSKLEYKVTGPGVDPDSRRRSDFSSSCLQKEDHGFSQRFQERARPPASDEDARTNLSTITTQQARDRPSPARGVEKKLTTVAQLLQTEFSNVGAARAEFPQESRRVDNHVRHPSARGHSERIGVPGKLLLSEGIGSNNGASRRRSQSCRRDSITSIADVSPHHYFGEQDQYLQHTNTATKFAVNTTSSDDKSRSSTMRLQPINVPTVSIGQRLSSLRESLSLKDHFSILGDDDDNDDPTILPKDSSSDQTKRIDTNSLTEPRRSSTSEKVAIPQMAGGKMCPTVSQPLDQDVYKKLSVKTRTENNYTYSGYTESTTSSSTSRASSTNSPRSTKSWSSFPASHLHRWLVNQFKLGSKSKSSKDHHVVQNEQQRQPQMSKKKSPWRSRPGEILQVITRKKGSKNSAAPAAAPLLDLQGLQNLRLRTSGIENGTQSPISRNGVGDPRMMDAGSGYSTSGRRNLDPQLQHHHRMMQHNNEEAGNSFTSPRHSLDAHLVHSRMMHNMENGGSYSTPSHQMMHMEAATSGLSTPSHRMRHKENGGDRLSTPSNRMMHKENGGGLSTPSRRLMQMDNGDYSSPSQRMMHMEVAGISTPSRRMMQMENGGYSSPSRRMMHMEAAGISTMSRRMMQMENAGYSSPSQRMMHMEAVGISTPSRRMMQMENAGYSSPSQRMMHIEAVGISTPSRRMMHMDSADGLFTTSRRITHFEAAGSISTPSRQIMYMEPDGSDHRQAYMLPPVPGSSPHHSQRLQNFFSAEG